MLQEAQGQSAASDFVVYDSLGVPINVRVTATLEERTDEDETDLSLVCRQSGKTNLLTGTDIAVGTGLLRFDGNGNFVSATNDRIAIDRTGDSQCFAACNSRWTSDWSPDLATQDASLAATRQDGSEPGCAEQFCDRRRRHHSRCLQ